MANAVLDARQEGDSYRRIEVITGQSRRRRWTAEEKARIVAETYAGGESVCAVARRYGLTQQQLFGWRRAARERTGDVGNAIAFAPLIVEARCPSAAVRSADPGMAVVEIVIGATTVRVRPGADASTLRTVLQAVKAVS